MDYFSPEGLEKLKIELEELKNKRQEISARIEEAKKFGDLSENAEYMEAREFQEFNERRIAEIEEIIKNAIIIEKHKKKDVVQIGSTIEVKSNGKIFIYTIIGSKEADPLINKISNESPLGKAFLDRKIDEEINVQTPKGAVKYKIIGIK